jgi:hypothetical protein
MATPFVNEGPVVAPPAQRNRAGGAVEALCAAAAIVLAIIGLAGGPRFFDAIAGIVLGTAFLFEVWTVLGGAHGASHERGLTAERVAGWVGVVLGILALLRLAPTFLAPIAVIVFGFGLALGMGMLSRAARITVGVCAIVLGILALLRLDPRTLTNISVIAVGAVLMFTGPAMAWRGRRMHAPAV